MKKLTEASGNFAKASKMRYVPAICLKITVLHKNYKTTQKNPVVKITKTVNVKPRGLLKKIRVQNFDLKTLNLHFKGYYWAGNQ